MYDDEINDDDELGALRDELSRTPAGEAPPLEAIVARGRARRRRRHSGVAGTGVAAAVVLAILLASVGGPAKIPSGHKVHVNLAAYSVDSNADGTVTVTMAAKQSFNPKALRQALAAAGVLAVVRVGTFCRTTDQPPGFSQVVVPTALSAPPAEGTQAKQGAQGSERAVQLNPSSRSKRTAVVISPSAMPRRAELSIGYFPDHVAMTLVARNTQMTCQIVDPANCQLPGPAAVRAFQSSGPAATTTLPGPASTALTRTANTLPPSIPVTLPAPATGPFPRPLRRQRRSPPRHHCPCLPRGRLRRWSRPVARPAPRRRCHRDRSQPPSARPEKCTGARSRPRLEVNPLQSARRAPVQPTRPRPRPPSRGPRQPPLGLPVRLPSRRTREVKCAGGLGRTPGQTRGARTPPRSSQCGPHGPSAAAPAPPGTTPTRRAPCRARTCHQCPWRRCPH